MKNKCVTQVRRLTMVDESSPEFLILDEKILTEHGLS